MFQSSPAPRRGRYTAHAHTTPNAKKFQSSPAPRRGRYVSPNVCEVYIQYVSILARTEARALQAAPGMAHGRIHVSILARTEARALRRAWQYSACSMLFQSSPAPRRGRYHGCAPLTFSITIGFNPRPHRGAGATRKVWWHLPGSLMFQSSPAPRRGRYRAACDLRPCDHRFNPRPHRGAGATAASRCRCKQ